jgi:hypothetical protein
MSETKDQENIVDKSIIEGDSQHVLGEETQSLILDSAEKETRERTPATYPGNYDTSMDVVEIIPRLPEHVEIEMQSWILGNRTTPIEDTSGGIF